MMYRLSAYSLVVGLLVVLVASTVGPGEVYQQKEPAKRLEIIEAHEGSWVFSNLLFGAGALTTALGFIALWMGLRGKPGGAVLGVAAGLYTIGALAWCVYLFQRVQDPGAYLYVRPMPGFLLVFVVLTLPSLLIFGIGWIVSGLPAWPGYVSAIGAVVIIALGLGFPDQFYSNFPPQVIYLFSLLAGIVLLRQ